jgi:diguanylate cyclase (GGDEF)-like protein
MEIHIQAADDIPDRWLLYSSRPVKGGYYAGGRIDQFVNISEQKKLQAKIELLAITDELTGIYNRRGLFELGLHDFTRAQRTNTLLSVLYLDIDRFKELNDQFGHAKGDQILIELVNRVQTQLRDMDIFARYGGDEFVIVIPDANLDQASSIAERIRTSISEKPFIINGKKYSLFSSIGVSQTNANDDFSELLDRADRCMYYSKQKGQNQISTEIDFENNDEINS